MIYISKLKEYQGELVFSKGSPPSLDLLSPIFLPSPYSLVTANLFSIPMTVISWMLFKGNNTVYILLRLFFFYLAQFPWAGCMYHFVLLLRSIVGDRCTTVCWIIYPLKDIWMVSSLGLLRITLLWTFVDKCLCEDKFAFVWDKCPTMQFLGHMLSPLLIFRETAKLFCGAPAPAAVCQGSSSSAASSVPVIICLFD